MTKLKTPLRIDGKRISTIEELRENFVLDEVLESYKNGVLQKWLDSRGFGEADKVRNIKAKNNSDILRELIQIFEVEYDEKEINESIKIFEYMERIEERKNEYRESNEKLSDLANKNIELSDSIFSNNTVNDYFLEYQALVNEMINSNEDGEKIIKIFKEILKHYNAFLALDYKRIFKTCKGNKKNVVLVMQMNKELRNFISYNPYYNKDELEAETELKNVFSKQVKNLTDMLSLKKTGFFMATCGEVKLKNTYMVISRYIYGEWSDINGEPSDIKCFKILEKNETIKYKGCIVQPLWAIEIDEEIYNAPLNLNTVAQKQQTTTQSSNIYDNINKAAEAIYDNINKAAEAINSMRNKYEKR